MAKRNFFVPGLTRAQRDVFEQIAIGQTPYARPETIKVLLDKELIVRIADRVVGRDRFGIISVPDYEVPIPVHMAWCYWCSQNYEPIEA
jgi:hypothetical protein